MLGARSWWLALSLTLGCRAGAFACDEPDDCAAAGDAGICQADGWCSFPTDDCPSGQRYGEHAGDGLAGTCVDGTDGTSSSATTSDQTTTLDPTIADTSLVTSDADTTTTASSTVADTTVADTLPDPTTDPTTDDTATTGATSVCGDGIVAQGEECDLGDSNGSGGPCRDDCQLNVCGDGYVGEGEQCEPDIVEHCNQDCTLVTCGNGRIDPNEACDPAAPIPGGCDAHGFVDGMLGCTSRCTISTDGCGGCGDDGCQFPECNDACPAHEYCVSYLNGQVCTASCTDDEDCASDVAGVFCENGECVIPCEFQDDCPFMSMACFNGQCAYPTDP